MPDVQLSLSDAQREYLTHLLETTLKNTRVEEHRTRTPSYREQVEQQETLIVELLTKLGKPPTK
jgi:hypothetical protein